MNFINQSNLSDNQVYTSN